MGNKIAIAEKAAHHADSTAPFREERYEYHAPLTYTLHPSKIPYGDIVNQGERRDIERPAKDVSELMYDIHLEAQLHHHNSGLWRSGDVENDGDSLFDLAILDLFRVVVRQEFKANELKELHSNYLKLRMLMVSRGLEPLTDLDEFRSHLRSVDPEVREELNIDDVDNDVSGMGLLPLEEEISSEIKQKFERASMRAVFATFRNGIKVPVGIDEKYQFSKYSPPLAIKDVKADVQRQALRNWVSRLIEETLSPLEFDVNEDNRQWSPVDILGAYATSALHDAGLKTAKKVSDWNYEDDTFPPHQSIENYTTSYAYLQHSVKLESEQTDHDTPPIEVMFQDIHQQTLELADEFNFTFEPVNVAIDLFRIPWQGSDDAPTISRPPSKDQDHTEEWTFVLLSIVDTRSRFTLGTRLLRTKSRYPAEVRNLLPLITKHFDINGIYVDAEMVSGDLINALRDAAGENFLINAPDRMNELENLIRATPGNRVGFVKNVSWNTLNRPNVIAYPYDSSLNQSSDDGKSLKNSSHADLLKSPFAFPKSLLGNTKSKMMDEIEETSRNVNLSQSTLNKSDATTIDESQDIIEYSPDLEGFADLPKVGNASTHALYITDKSIPEHSPSQLRDLYKQRWAIEESINQIKNHYRAKTNSEYAEKQVFATEFAILFQNWHTLINRARSPQYQLLLNVTYQELLKAIQDVVFTD